MTNISYSNDLIWYSYMRPNAGINTTHNVIYTQLHNYICVYVCMHVVHVYVVIDMREYCCRFDQLKHRWYPGVHKCYTR